MFLKTLWAPKEGLESLKGRWWLAFVVVLVAVLLGVALRVWGSHEVIVQAAMERLKGAPPEQVEAARKFLALPFLIGSSVVSAGVAFTVGVFLQALVFNLSLPLLGGEPQFTRTLTAVSGSKLAIGLGALLSGLLSFLVRQPVRFDLGALFPEASALNKALGSVEVFSLWSLVLLAEGLVSLGKAKRAPAYAAVFGLWALWAVASGLIGILAS